MKGFWDPFFKGKKYVLKLNNLKPNCYIAIAADEKLQMKSCYDRIFRILQTMY